MTNQGSDNVSLVDLATKTAGFVITLPAGDSPDGIVIAPNDKSAYVSVSVTTVINNQIVRFAGVTPIDLATNVVGADIGLERSSYRRNCHRSVS